LKRHLFTFIQHVLDQVKAASHCILFLDYDGTLVPLCKEPSQAQLPPATRRLLKNLSCNSRYSVGIISGRSLKDIRTLVGIERLWYAGNHGFEMEVNNRVWKHPALKTYTGELKQIVRGLQDCTRDIPGIAIEDKGSTVSIHYRNVTGRSPGLIFKRVAQTVELFPDHFTIARGKKVFEVRPLLDWDKGKAVEEFTRRCAVKGRPLTIYIGDDQTDEDAFGVLAPDDISIRVGYRRGSAARYYCKGTGEVLTFLRLMHGARPG